MNADLIFLASGLVALAIVTNLLVRAVRKSQPGQSWLTRDLHRGDLRALAKLLCGQRSSVMYGQIKRLEDRKFVRKGADDFRVTLKGCVAVILRITLSRSSARS